VPIPRYSNLLQKIWQDPSKWDFLIAICAGIGAVYSAVVDGKVVMAYAASALCLATLCKAIATLRRNLKQKSTHELKGCLETLHAMIRKEDFRLWVTLHVPIENGQRLEQILDYVGDNEGKKAGRKFPAQCGVIGQALRFKEPVRFVRTSDDYGEYVKELVKEWGYTEGDAKKANPGTMSAYAAPLLEKEEVKCVVYLGSNDRNMFSDHTVSLIHKACIGIAHFIEERYSS
jgi:hypothetical protein